MTEPIQSVHRSIARREAIGSLIGAWAQRDGEFCVGVAEYEESRAEMFGALRALGVSDDEIADYYAEDPD